MAFCNKCGVELEAGSNVCKSCGNTNEAPKTTEKTEVKAKKNLKDLLKIIDGTSYFQEDDIQKNKIMSLFSYIGLLFLIPLFACKDSKFARFHTNQGIVLCILGVALEVIAGIVMGVTALFLIPDMVFFKVVAILCMSVEGLIFWVLGLALTALMVLGIISAVTGKAKKLPIIGNIRILK